MAEHDQQPAVTEAASSMPSQEGGTMAFGRYDYASFLTYFAYAAASIVAPVSLVSLARDLGFQLEDGGMTAGGALHLGRTAAIVAAMLLCAFWAGRWGKRRTLGASVILMGVGMGICAIAPVYGVVFLALVVAGIGEGAIEGVATPFVQDLHPKEPGRYVNFSHAFWSIGVLVTVLAAGALLSGGVSWRLIVGGVALGALLPASLLLIPPSHPKHAYPERPEDLDSKSIGSKIRFILGIPRFWLFFAAMFVAGGGEFCLTFWSASFIQLSLSTSAWMGGVGTACFATGMALGRMGGGYWVRQHHLKAFIVISAIAGVVISLFLPQVMHLGLFLALLFLVGIATAPFWPSIQSYCADRIPEADMTLLMILLACAGIPGCGVATWLMGYIGDRSGLGVAFYLVPACYLILGLLIGYEGYARKKQGPRAR
jgi:MFS family permease